MTGELISPRMNFPPVEDFTGPILQNLTESLETSRDILATNDQIQTALDLLPTVIGKIPAEKCDENMARMCVAITTGLFDSAFNYAWNAAVSALRCKTREFGFNSISQVFNMEFDEKKLLSLQDSELILLCLRLNLVSEKGFFALNQCRDIRNSLAATCAIAHTPPDAHEFLNFLECCCLHALKDDQNRTSFDIMELIDAINSNSFSSEQIEFWVDRICRTFSAQRETAIRMLHGIYCDEGKQEFARVSAIKICRKLTQIFDPNIKTELMNQHHQFIASGNLQKIEASQIFFEELEILGLLSEPEKHALISSACKSLMGVHNRLNNFLNERPFAERLASLSKDHQIPESVRYEYVETVATCSVGNEFRTAQDADTYYQDMIKGFSQKEVEILILLPDRGNIVAQRIRDSSRCKEKFKEILRLLSTESIPQKMQSAYEKWIQQ